MAPGLLSKPSPPAKWSGHGVLVEETLGGILECSNSQGRNLSQLLLGRQAAFSRCGLCRRGMNERTSNPIPGEEPLPSFL